MSNGSLRHSGSQALKARNYSGIRVLQNIQPTCDIGWHRFGSCSAPMAVSLDDSALNEMSLSPAVAWWTSPSANKLPVLLSWTDTGLTLVAVASQCYASLRPHIQTSKPVNLASSSFLKVVSWLHSKKWKFFLPMPWTYAVWQCGSIQRFHLYLWPMWEMDRARWSWGAFAAPPQFHMLDF